MERTSSITLRNAHTHITIHYMRTSLKNESSALRAVAIFCFNQKAVRGVLIFLYMESSIHTLQSHLIINSILDDY